MFTDPFFSTAVSTCLLVHELFTGITIVPSDSPPIAAPFASCGLYQEMHGRTSSTPITDYAFPLVWTAFNMQKFGDYHNLCLLRYVLKLTNILQIFGDINLGEYGMDPCIFTLARVCLKRDAKNDRGAIATVNRYRWSHVREARYRGSVAMALNRYAVANYPLILDCYDAVETNTYTLYTDCDNNVGCEPCCNRPLRRLLMDRSKRDRVSGHKYREGRRRHQMYPQSRLTLLRDRLHDLNCDYPLVPVLQRVPPGMLSPYSKSIRGV